MASACFSTFNGSLAAGTQVSTRSDGRLCSVTLRSLQSLRPVEHRALSLTALRKAHYGKGVLGVVHARAELSTEEVEALAAPVKESDISEDEATREDESSGEEAKLYVGNLSWSCTSADLAECFQEVGNVEVVEAYKVSSVRGRLRVVMHWAVPTRSRIFKEVFVQDSGVPADLLVYQISLSLDE